MGSKPGLTPTDDTIAPTIDLTGVKSSYAVGDLWSSDVAKDWCIATDDRDGEVDCVLNDTNLPLELLGGSYYLNTVGSYTITYSATDAAGNTRTRDLTITISEGQLI